MKIILAIIFMSLISVELQPKQIELLQVVSGNEKSIIGYGGSAGGAKSHGIRDVSLTLSGDVPGLKTLIIRRNSKELISNHINPFFQKYGYLRQYFNKTERLIYYPNGSLTKFGCADIEDDIYSFQGDEYDIIFIDEATHFTQVMIEFLMTRNRSVIKGFKAKTILTMNPGNIGHAYVKRIFIDKVYKDNEDPNDYYFIPARIYDNVIWSLESLKDQNFTVTDYYENWDDNKRKDFCYNYSEYAKRLSKLPEQLKRAYLEGDWDVFGGQFFNGLNKKQQVIQPFLIPPGWKLIGSVDPGYSSPCSFGLLAQDFERNIYRVAGYYESEKSPEQHAEGIFSFIKQCKFTNGRMPSLIVSGRDAFAKKDRYSIIANEKTFADVFQAHGMLLTPAVTDRVLGWWTWKSLIPNKFFMFEGFNNDLLREMESVISDSKKVEDIQGGGNDPNVSDHALDEVRYGIMSLYEPFDRDKSKEAPPAPGQDKVYKPVTQRSTDYSDFN